MTANTGTRHQANKQRIVEIAKRVSDEHLADKEIVVKKIIADLIADGDEALIKYCKKFDNYDVLANCQDSKNPFRVAIGPGTSPRGTSYFEALDSKLQNALKKSKERIEYFHKQEIRMGHFEQGWDYKGPLGETLGVRYQALDSVAVYIPGGQAPLVSTVLMTAILAKVAGVKRVVMFSPPPINRGILAAAELAAVDEVYAVGGAQAVAAAAYGTETIKPVDKIVGPGNIFVSLAKKIVYGKIGIDGIYGPSELAILADSSGNPALMAADLISQLEHGSGLESCLLVLLPAKVPRDEKELAVIREQLAGFANQVKAEFERQVNYLSKSKIQLETIYNSFKQWSDILLADNVEDACELINLYAPEHLELQLSEENLKPAQKLIKHAAAIFIGANSCESLGDYIAGPSHCLPTGSTTRFSSGLQAIDFLKKSSIVDFSNVKTRDPEFRQLIKDVAEIARAELLEGHAVAMEKRDL